jgi:hypothetical protein
MLNLAKALKTLRRIARTIRGFVRGRYGHEGKMGGPAGSGKPTAIIRPKSLSGADQRARAMSGEKLQKKRVGHSAV